MKLSFIFLILSSFIIYTLQQQESSSDVTTLGTKLENQFKAKTFSHGTVWHLMKKFHTNKPAKDSVIYKVSDLVETFFVRKEKPQKSEVEGILILSGEPSPFGVWEYKDLKKDTIGTKDTGSVDENWEKISVPHGNILHNLSVPHWYIGAVHVEDACESICDSSHSITNRLFHNCQKGFQQHGSMLFIPISKYIRFRRRKMLWNYFESMEKTKIVFQPVFVTHHENSGSANEILPEVPISDFAILRAEWTDCSGEPIISHPKKLDACNLCGGDNSTCVKCAKGRVFHHGRCSKIEDIMSENSLRHNPIVLDHSGNDNNDNVEQNSILPLNITTTLHDGKSDIGFANNLSKITNGTDKLMGNGQSIDFSDNLGDVPDATLNWSKELLVTNMKGHIEIRGPDIVYADGETILQVQPIPCESRNTSTFNFTLNRKLHWHINGTLVKGIDWIQQGAKLRIVKNVLRPLNLYKITTYMEMENQPGVVYSANKHVKVMSKGICASLEVKSITVNSKEFILLDASSSKDLDNLKDDNSLKFFWECFSPETKAPCKFNNSGNSVSKLETQKAVEKFDGNGSSRKIRIDKSTSVPGLYLWKVTVVNSYARANITKRVKIPEPGADLRAQSDGRSINMELIEENETLKNYLICTKDYEKHILNSISIILVVTPSQQKDTRMGTLFSFNISVNSPLDVDQNFAQGLTFSIGYILERNYGKNESAPDDDARILWLQTSTILINVVWDYLPIGDSVVPVVKLCTTAPQCTQTFFSPVKADFHPTSAYCDACNVRGLFEDKIFNLEINGALTFFHTVMVTANRMGDKECEIKLLTSFSRSVEMYSDLITEGVKKGLFYKTRNLHGISKKISRKEDHLDVVTDLFAKGGLGKQQSMSNESQLTLDETGNAIRNKRYIPKEVTTSTERPEAELISDNATEAKEALMNDTSEMCLQLSKSNKNEDKLEGKQKRMKIMYMKNVSILTSKDFSLSFAKEGENSSLLTIDFRYSLRKYISECDKGPRKSCYAACWSTLQFFEAPFKPTEDLESFMWKPMVYLINHSTKEIVSNGIQTLGPILLEFNISRISPNRTMECKIGDTRIADWKDDCISTIIQKAGDRVLQCFCYEYGYIKVLEVEQSAMEITSVEHKRVQFSIINPDFNWTMGYLRRIFEKSLAKQLAKTLNTSQIQIERLDAEPGVLIVNVLLGSSLSMEGQTNHSHSKSLEDVVQLLENKITTGSLILTDLENRLLNVSQTSFTRKIAEEMNIVLGIIIGSILIIGIVTFSVSSFRKYRQEKLDSVRPIKPTYITDGENDIEKFDSPYNFNNVPIEELQTDANYDGISCIDTSDISIQRIAAISDSGLATNNSTRSSIYTNHNPTNFGQRDSTISNVNVTHTSGDYGISAFPNTITN